MSGETVHNLLSGTRDWSGGWANADKWRKSGTHDGFVVMRKDTAWTGLYKPVALTAGTTYTFSAMVRVPAGKKAHIYLSSGNTVNDTYLANSEFAGGHEFVVTGDGGWFEIHHTFTPTASKAVRARIEADDSYAIEVCAFMLVEGTTPAAWAPAEGETLAGGGALMSANLWDAATANHKPGADGVYLAGKTTGELKCIITGASALTENQTIHMSASLRGEYNLLRGDAVKNRRIVPGFEWPGFAEPNNWTQRAACVPGHAYTLSIVTDVAGEVCFGFYLADGSVSRPNGYEAFPAGKSVVRTLTAPEGAEYVAASWAGGNRRPMVVEGTKPAAWAPAEGEDIGCLKPFVEYRDATGNLNWVGFPAWTPTSQWQRFEATCVVPSGMTITKIGFNTSGATGDIEVMNPAWSYGSPVCLASSAHTPYATQDHVMVTYATKASLKVTDDSVKAEVSARAQTDRNVADLSSRLTQTANSLTTEISDRRSAITTVTGLANAAQSTADAAKSSASNAVSTANSASTSAANAVKTANAASSAASSASTAAGKASTDAAAAVKTANSASSTASGAVTTANEAAATANAASDTATAAQTMATENRSSIKQLSNSITSEVTQRTKTDQMVSDLSSKLTQTADGFNASIDRLSDTDKKVNSWFGFGADSSGNPQLTMGSSSSPVVGVYTNAGLAYKARSGATLLELDGASRSSTMPHVHADDVSMGSWQWVPTQNGTHFTLQWIGG